MWDQAANAVKAGDDRDMSMLSSSLVINFGAKNRPVENGFIEILDGPTGFMVIKRSVFTTLEEKFLTSGVRMITRIGTSMNTMPFLTV